MTLSAINSILTKAREVSEIVCLDINPARAKRIAERLKDSRLRVEWVYTNDPNDLSTVTKEAEVVINATLPKFNL